MANNLPITEEAIGVINGVNTSFETSATYTPGTLYAYLNGQMQQKNYVTELGGKQVEVEFAPEVGDTFHFRYLPVVV